MSHLPHKLIITADDFGMCPSVDTAIEACLSAGTVQSTNVMANLADFERVRQLRVNFPQVSLGIHWNLTLGLPACKPVDIPTLLDSKGYFFPIHEFKNNLLKGKIKKLHILKELTAQYLRFRDMAGEPDYWCTHENIHHSPLLYKIITGHAKILNIFTMRNHSRLTNKQSFRLYLKNQWFLKNLSWAKLQGMFMPAGVLDFSWMGQDKTSIVNVAHQMPWPISEQPVELIIHPATRLEPELFGNLQHNRIDEYSFFSQADLVERLRNTGVLLVGYEKLH